MHMEASTNEVFRALADTFSFSEQEHFFELICEQLAEILAVDHVLLARVKPDELVAKTIAFYSNGQHHGEIEYSLTGTPCATINEQNACLYNGGVAEQFPNDAMLADIGVESYIGFPLINRQGKKLGLIALMYNQTINNPELAIEVLRVTGSFLATEMQRREHEHKIADIAFTDLVSGLPNRISFIHRVDAAIEKAQLTQQTLSVLMINIRRFKEVNDTYNHAVGDALLKAVGQRLVEYVDIGSCVARFSSDEFGILLPQTNAAQLPQAIENVKSAFFEPVQVDSRNFSVQVVVGAANYSALDRQQIAHGISSDGLLQRASIALEHARTAATQSRIYDVSMSEALLTEQHMLERLQLAIANETLLLYYQPQFDIDTGKLRGAEALCRWYDEELGWVSPMQFIPLAEERGLIHELGDWVMRKAVHQLHDWLPNYHGYLSVNISARQFDDPYMADYLIEQTRSLPKGRLVVELTESIMMGKSVQALRQFQRISDHGISIAVDDFGTGFSSLAYLTQFPISMLKIDRSFVQNLASGAHEYTIAATIIAMAKALNLSTVAEGVETAEQEVMLANLGCNRTQGFLRGKPVAAEEFAARWFNQ